MANYNLNYTGQEVDSAIASVVGGNFATTSALATGLATKQNTLTSAQLSAVNSGITSQLVSQIGAGLTGVKVNNTTASVVNHVADLGNLQLPINSLNKLNPDYITNGGDNNYLPTRIDRTNWNNKPSGIYMHNIDIQCACSQWQIRFAFYSTSATSYTSDYNGLYTYLTTKFGIESIYVSGLAVDGSSYNNLTYIIAGDTSANKILHAYFISDNHTLTQVYANTSATSVTDIVVAL